MANYLLRSSPRNTYENPRIFMIDARILVLFLVCIVHARWYTLGPTVLATLLLVFFEVRLNMAVPSAMRWVRSWLAGSARPNRPPNRRMKSVDYQRIGVYWGPAEKTKS